MTSSSVPSPDPSSAASSASSDDSRYRLLRRIGAGGMAEVFLAKQRLGAGGMGERTVVVKRMLPHLADDTKFVRLFVREARLASQLQHPNVVQIHDVASLSGRAAIVMEHLRGIDARAAFRAASQRGKGLDPATAIAIAEQVALGLDHAHHATDESGAALGIVHRDVSPHNVFLTRQGVVKVLDFGVARSRLEETATGSVKGKLAYMAPEQAFRRPIDQRTDLFALGVVLWELLTGKRLFRGASPAETLQALLHAPIRAPSTIVNVPPELDAIVLKTLAREPTQRWPRGRDLAAALARARADLTDETATALVARLVEDVSPEENTPTTPAEPDSDVRDAPPIVLDVAVGASARLDRATIDDALGRDDDDGSEDEIADPPPALPVQPPAARWPWIVAASSTLIALGIAVVATLPPASTERDDDTIVARSTDEPASIAHEPIDPAPAVQTPVVETEEPDAGATPITRTRSGVRTRPRERASIGRGIDRDYP
ncbi:MAG: serine/threonine protein kinase [Deltaproteobacteria bacterium]|nr:serine/threonine protein kinase [Deltaproteobacteria bacterium]